MRLIPHDQYLNGGFTLYWSIRWGRLSFRISTFFGCLEQFATFVFKKNQDQRNQWCRRKSTKSNSNIKSYWLGGGNSCFLNYGVSKLTSIVRIQNNMPNFASRKFPSLRRIKNQLFFCLFDWRFFSKRTGA